MNPGRFIQSIAQEVSTRLWPLVDYPSAVSSLRGPMRDISRIRPSVGSLSDMTAGCFRF